MIEQFGIEQSGKMKNTWKSQTIQTFRERKVYWLDTYQVKENVTIITC